MSYNANNIAAPDPETPVNAMRTLILVQESSFDKMLRLQIPMDKENQKYRVVLMIDTYQDGDLIPIPDPDVLEKALYSRPMLKKNKDKGRFGLN